MPVAVQGLGSGVQAIGASDDHNCAVVNGGAQCWGDNYNGDLGNNSTTPSQVPVPAEGLGSGVQALTGGDSHTCALVNGAIWCWGNNLDGEVGNGSDAGGIEVPVAVLGFGAGVQAIAAGGNHTCALVQSGVQCWGDNADGELGDNATLPANPSFVPVAVIGPDSEPQGITAGHDHTCAIVSGAIECWGNGANGELGNNSTINSAVPVVVVGLPSPGGGAQSLASGLDHTCAIVNGAAFCWGLNANGQLGNKSNTDSPVPVSVVGLDGGVEALTAGYGFTCALVSGGVLCWGDDALGELGDGSDAGGSSVPVGVAGLASGVQAIAAGGSHACALASGAVLCWGDNVADAGPLAGNNPAGSSVPEPVPNLTSDVQALAAGEAHTCALVNGGVECWGNNGDGQLGNNSPPPRPGLWAHERRAGDCRRRFPLLRSGRRLGPLLGSRFERAVGQQLEQPNQFRSGPGGTLGALDSYGLGATLSTAFRSSSVK